MRGVRVGIVNPRTAFGSRVRELLPEHLSVVELKLFESEVAGEATLAQFENEVVVTQPLDPDLFPKLDVLFFAGEDRDLLNRMAMEAAEDDVLTIVLGAVGLESETYAPGIRETAATTSRPYAVPRMSSYLVGSVIQRIASAFPVSRANATVLLPAGARGESGASELHQQIVSLLNFKSPPTEIFGEQIAFNVSVAGTGAGAPALAETVTKEASRLSGVDALSVSLVQVPVFHSTAASIWVGLEAPAEPRRLVALFRDPPFHADSGRAAKAPSALSVAESSHIHVGAIRATEGPHPGCWLWAVADTTAYDPALAAVELAKAVLGQQGAERL